MKFTRLLSKYDYADLRIERGSESNVNLKDSETKVYTGTFFGISVRVLKDGAWGFASTNNPETDISGLLKKAENLSSIKKSTSSISAIAPVKKTIKDKYEITDAGEQASELLDAKKLMQGKDIISTIVSCSDVHTVNEFYSSEGSEIIQDYSYSYLTCLAVAKYKGLIQRAVETSSSRKGFNGLKTEKPCIDAGEKVQRLITKSKPAPKGRFTVILDPEMTGVLTHEAVGHASEADSVASAESVFAGKQGKKIASELVNIIDDPSMRYFGFYDYDDEGVKGKRTEIIRKGVLKNFINSRETAKETNAKPNGHARAEDASSVPIVRMSNTFFLKGKSCIDDVFDVPEAIYLKGMIGGSVDTFTGGFMFKAEEAYEIRNGEKKGLLRDVTITGNLLEILNNVIVVGNDFGTSPGMCGKLGQSVPVEDGGPHIQVKDVVVG